MRTQRRAAPLALLLIGLAAQAQVVTPTKDAAGSAPPAKPTNLWASAEHDAVTPTWTASTDQTGAHYAILRRNRDTDALGVFHVIDSNAGPETSYTDRSVAAASRYGYRAGGGGSRPGLHRHPEPGLKQDRHPGLRHLRWHRSGRVRLHRSQRDADLQCR